VAMVHIARGQLQLAAEALRMGTPLQDRQAGRASRYPASGLHWLLGLVLLAQGEVDEARAEFQRELETGAPSSLYHVEFTMNAHDGLGFASLASRQPDAGAKAFERALSLMPGHARSHLGLATCHLASGHQADAQRELENSERAIAELARAGRHLEAELLGAMAAVVRGQPTNAISTLDRLLTEAPPGYPGWTIPIEPLLKPLQAQPEFGSVLAKLAERAR
jgi:tetratricopeptide (TPR) repeat protein